MDGTENERIHLFTASVDETEALAAACAQALLPGSVLALTGDLGAGKTCFARGFARGWDVSADVPITSPTFTLLNIYEGRSPIYHLDLYRLSGGDDLEAIGYYDLLDGEGVLLIEWADRIPDAWGEQWLNVHLTGSGDTREVVLVGKGWERMMWEKLQEVLVAWIAT